MSRFGIRVVVCALLACPAALLAATATVAPTAQPQTWYSGMLLPSQTALVKSKFDERVAEVPVRLGNRVKTGDLLLRFMDDEYRVAQDRAAALLERAQSEFERARRLHDQGQLSADEFEKAGTTLKLARADSDLAAIQLRERSIVAPFDGVLAERYVDPGASVKQGDPLLRLTATSPLRVQVLLPESLLPQIRQLPMLRVALASPETTLWLPVRRAPLVVDPASGMFPLQVDVDNSHGRLTPGVSCRVGLAPRRRPAR